MTGAPFSNAVDPMLTAVRDAGLALALLLTGASLAFAHEPSAAPAGETAPPPTAVAAPAGVVDAFHAALARGDTAAASALMTDDVLVLESGGAERSKAAYAAHHLAADAAFSKASRDTRQHRTGGVAGDVAWVATEGRVQGETGGRAIDRMTTETMLLRRTPQGWRIFHVHWSSRAAPSPTR